MKRGILGRTGVATLTAVVALLAVPGSAPAAVTCDFASGVLTVDMGGSSDLAVARVSGANIIVQDGGFPVTCTGSTPTVTNTAALSIFNHSGASGGTVIIEPAGDFAPGPALQDGSDNAGGTPEIEIFVNLHDAPNGLLSVRGAGGNIRWGQFGINPNAFDTEVQPDYDIFPLNVKRLDGRAGSSAGTLPATLGAQGGAGTGPALTQDIDLQGNNGADQLTGGDGNDTLQTFGDNDFVLGGAGDDNLDPGTGNDTVDGEAGVDTLSWSFSTPSIAVDLRIVGPQNTGAGGIDSFANIENLSGTGGPDVLRGDDGPNKLTSSGGNDILEGRGGNDTLDAGAGDDRLELRDGGPDSADCGTGTDIVTADLPGVDSLLSCETVSFATPTTGTPTAGIPTPIADTAAPSITEAKADPKLFEVDRNSPKETAVTSAKKGTTFRFRLSEAATTTFTIQRRTKGRRVNGKCVRKTKANAKRKPCTRFRRVGAFRALGVAGDNAKTFSGRISSTTLRPGSYRALLSAVDAAGNHSQPAKVVFTVLKPKPKRHR